MPSHVILFRTIKQTRLNYLNILLHSGKTKETNITKVSPKFNKNCLSLFCKPKTFDKLHFSHRYIQSISMRTPIFSDVEYFNAYSKLF